MSEQWVRDPNPKYVLSASIGLTTLRLRFEAPDDESAALHAIREIMDRAVMEQFFYDDQKFWSKGLIVLTTPSGAVIQTMASKGESNG